MAYTRSTQDEERAAAAARLLQMLAPEWHCRCAGFWISNQIEYGVECCRYEGSGYQSVFFDYKNMRPHPRWLLQLDRYRQAGRRFSHDH